MRLIQKMQHYFPLQIGTTCLERLSTDHSLEANLLFSTAYPYFI